MALFGDTEITVDRFLKFLQFQAHREKQVTEETLDKALERCLNPQKQKRHKKTGNTTKGTKYVFNVDDYVKVMDHIQNDIVSLEPKNWDPTNRIKNVQKYCSALIRYADEDTARGL